MNQKAVVICLISHDLSNREKLNLLSNNSYMKSLLDIVKGSVQLPLDPDNYLESILCVFWNLTHELVEEIEGKLIEEIVDVIITAFETFPNHQKIVENALKIMCNESILEDIVFDRYKFIQLVMNSLVRFKNRDMNLMAVEIRSVISSRKLMSEKLNIGSNPIYMETLLNIIRSSVQTAPDYDIILLYTLSFLWNLSDLSPNTCELFLQKGGLDLYFLILNVRFF
jgi:Zyg-11 family protein